MSKSSSHLDAVDSLVTLTKHSAVDNKGSSVADDVSGRMDDPIKPWYHFNGVAIAQGYNLVGQDSCLTTCFDRRELIRLVVGWCRME